MTATLVFSTKKEVSKWLRELGIDLASLKLKQGRFFIYPVMPPRVRGAALSSDLLSIMDSGGGWKHDGRKYSPEAGYVDMTPEDVAVQDAYVARLNELERLLAPARNVSLGNV